MKKLLNIVKDKMAGQTVDITMKFTLSALWNLTDESPSTCQMFLEEGGLDLFMEVLDVSYLKFKKKKSFPLSCMGNTGKKLHTTSYSVA